ncbi:uncharacterized protein C8Q71DRAFT_55266 [Rhodofomes roseus]|uniref:Uncharacterized protein n=1 Tax=Rhodofomes roseus TaxID=34475 RepID=A0ABQ8KGB1_9APHY|nr:uncharacterized protein C8Q71DRAFT_55266 [Rhodofomes roseus]KAH9836706.1 hypothetical protein C8Q71DRAFT_55266 [Rhodofomes roseus]
MDGGTTTAITQTARTSPPHTPCAVDAKLALTPRRTHNEGKQSDDALLPPDGQPRSPDTSPSPEPDPDANGGSPRRTSPRMRRQMTIELPPNEPFEVLYDHKVSVEDHSPKPCIVPGNALHLIDDDPSPRSQTPSSVIIIADGTEIHVGSHDRTPDQAGDGGDRSSSEPPPGARPQPRVRFRSRVRITSGVHKHRHSGTPAPQGQRRLSSGTPSSGSSPSSSISAPLRYQADENAAWGPLGRRLSAFAAAGRRKHVQAPPQYGEGVNGGESGAHTSPNERSALLRSARNGGYVDPYDAGVSEGDEDDLEEELGAAELRRQKELVFGPWPGRLLNLHWWWWHLEPIVCCTYCSEDSDYDE